MTTIKDKRAQQPGRRPVAGEPGPAAIALPAVAPLTIQRMQVAQLGKKNKKKIVTTPQQAPADQGKKRKAEKQDIEEDPISLADFMGADFSETDEETDEDYDFEETEEQKAKREAVMAERKKPWFSAMTSNLEKIGAGTSRAVKKRKINALGETMDIMHPTFTSFQEVTEPSFFFDGQAATRRSPAVTGLYDYKPGIVPQQHSHLEPTLGNEFEMMNGFPFRSGSYKESYSSAYDDAKIHDVPEMEYYNREDEEFQAYDEEQGPLIFGKEADGIPARSRKKPTTARNVTAFRFNLSNSPYTLRPPIKKYQDDTRNAEYEQKHRNLSHRDEGYTPVTFMNIHTSPSISTITSQMQEHMKLANQRQRSGEVVLQGGDAYMEKSAKKMWAETKKSKDWDLVHSEQNTNYPGKGEGQVADIFMGGSRTMTPDGPGLALAPPSDNYYNMEDYFENPASEDELSTWRDEEIDHTPVFSSFQIHRGDQTKEKKKKNK